MEISKCLTQVKISDLDENGNLPEPNCTFCKQWHTCIENHLKYCEKNPAKVKNL